MPKKTRTIIITVVIVVILSLLIIPKISSSDDNSTKNPAQTNKNSVLAVKAHVISSETMGNNIQTSGTVLANEEVELKSEVAGKIVKIAFKEGTRVGAGALLVKINDAELQAELTRAKYRLELISDQEYRQKQLLEKEAISQSDYDVSLNELNVARAEIELIQAQIDETEIRAPFNGIIGLKNVSEGSYVTSETIIASLQNINPVKIDFSVPEKYAGMVKIGDGVNFSIVGNENRYTGKVYAIEPKIDPLTRTLKIRALYPNTDRKILPGSFADVELVLQEIKDAYLIPTQAIVPELKGQKVFLFKNGKAVSQKVETGVRTDTRVQITSGISENDTVITSGILQIKPDMPVSISEIN